MRSYTKRRRQTVTSKGGKLGSISDVRVAFAGYSSLFEETVVTAGR